MGGIVGWRRRVSLLALSLALPAVAVSSASAADPSGQLVVLVADRTTSRASSFDMEFGLTWHTGGGGFFGDLGVRVSGRGVMSMTPDGMTSFGYGDNETAMTHGTTVVSACRDVSTITCVDAGPGAVAAGTVDYSDEGLSAGVPNHWLFVITPNVKVKFAGKGWAIHRLSTNAHVVTDTQTDDYELNVLGESASVFTHAAAPGSAGGSLAEAVPPCSNAQEPSVREGVGSLTLSGGVAQPTEMCPGLAFGQAIGSWSPRATTWNASGHVVGVSTLYNARLLVIDTPKHWTPRTA